MELSAYHAGDGSGGEHLKVDALGVLIHVRGKLNAEEGYFLVNAFNFAGFVKLKLLGFVKNPAVEPVFAGVLIAPGAPFCFFSVMDYFEQAIDDGQSCRLVVT